MADYEGRDPRTWRRVPAKRLRSFVASLARRCRVYAYDRATGDWTTYLWSQPHGNHCGVIGWRTFFQVRGAKNG